MFKKIITTIIVLLIGILGPLSYNYFFQQNVLQNDKLGVFQASDLLSYFGTLMLGLVALVQNIELQELNRSSNKDAVVARVIDFELYKRDKFIDALVKFLNSVELSSVCNIIELTKDKKLDKADIATLNDLELDVEKSYYYLCMILGINPDKANESDEDFYKAVGDYYFEYKLFIDALRKYKTSDCVDIRDKLVSKRDELDAIYNVYVRTKDMELSKRVYDKSDGNIGTIF